VKAITLELVSKMTATSMPAQGIIHNATKTTGDTLTDEIIAVARVQDAGGTDIVPSSGVVTFKAVDAAGAVVGQWATSEDSTLMTSACTGGVGVNDTLGTCEDTVELLAGLKKAGAVALFDNDKASTAPLTSGTITVTASFGTGTAKVEATATFEVAGKIDTITISGDATVGIGESGSITATALDADGNAVADGTTITFQTSASVVALLSTTGAVANTATTSGGTASMTTLGLSGGTSEVFGIAGGKTGSLQITIGEAVVAPPAVAAAGFTGDAPAADSIGLLVTSGASTPAELITALADAGCTAESVATLTGGAWLVYISGAPDVVNAAFPTSLAATTPFFVRC
jgi:hypothetical protein